jgi:2-dehydropantoate 2-reductase
VKVLIVGAGAVGGYFGARLAAAGRDVTLLVHAARAAQLRDGVTISSGERVTATPVRMITVGTDKAQFDAILIAVKAYQLAKALEELAPYVGPRTMLLPVLNGMRHMDMLRGRFGAPHVLGGVAKVATSLDEHGRIIDEGSFHDLVYGEWSGEKTSRILDLDSFLKGADFDARLSVEIEREMWEKWAMLASLGAITCLLDGNIGQVARAPGGVAIVQKLCAEVARTIAAAWQPLSEQFQSQLLSWLTNTASTQTSSMYRDLKAGRSVEADQIIGDLIARAASTRVDVPLLAAAFVRLKVYEQRTATY